jgi:tripeptidyl-peptidase-1
MAAKLKPRDAIYPDPAPGGYHHKADCGTVDVASVSATSYYYEEPELTAAYETRQCNE